MAPPVHKQAHGHPLILGPLVLGERWRWENLVGSLLWLHAPLRVVSVFNACCGNNGLLTSVLNINVSFVIIVTLWTDPVKSGFRRKRRLFSRSLIPSTSYIERVCDFAEV